MAGSFPTAVYLLCFLTSSACAFLLGRSLVAHLGADPSVERDLLYPARR